MPLNSSLFRNDPKLQACLTLDSAHVVQGATGPHVTRIQKALEIVFDAEIDHGDISGQRYGKSTADWVLAYKKDRWIVNTAYQQDPDNIVGKKTIRQLDDELLEIDKAKVVEKAYATIPAAIALVRSAKARLVMLRGAPAVGPGGVANPELRIFNWNFKGNKSNDPAAQLNRVLDIYEKMDQSLFFAAHMRHQFDLFLFSPRYPDDPGAPAYTTFGGMYAGIADKNDRGEYKKAIYFTPEFENKVDAASIVVHEFSHYCGGVEKSQEWIGHRASPFPKPHGRALEDGTADYEHMSANDAYRNAQSYQCYCEPLTKGKPPDGF